MTTLLWALLLHGESQEVRHGPWCDPTSRILSGGFFTSNISRSVASSSMDPTGNKILFEDSSSQRLLIVDIGSGRIIHTFDSTGLFEPRWSSDGSKLAVIVISATRNLTIWSDQSHAKSKQSSVIRIPGSVDAVAWGSFDDIAVAQNDTITIYHLMDNTAIIRHQWSDDTCQIRDITFGQNGNYIAASCLLEIKVYRLPDTEIVAIFPVVQARQLVWDSQGWSIAGLTEVNLFVCVLDTTKPSVPCWSGTTLGARVVAWVKGGTMLLVAGSGLELRDPVTLAVVQSFPNSAGLFVGVTNDFSRVSFLTTNGALTFWNPASMSVRSASYRLSQWNQDQHSRLFWMSPEKALLATDSEGFGVVYRHSVAEWNINNGLISPVPGQWAGYGACTIANASANKLIAFGTEKGEIVIVQNSQEMFRVYTNHSFPVTILSWSRDCQALATISTNPQPISPFAHAVMMWRWNSSTLTRVGGIIRLIDQQFPDAALNHDGSLLVLVPNNEVWDVTRNVPALIKTLVAECDPVCTRTAWSFDDSYLAFGGPSGISVWKYGEGELMYNAESFTQSLSWSPSTSGQGCTLAMSGREGEIWYWSSVQPSAVHRVNANPSCKAVKWNPLSDEILCVSTSFAHVLHVPEFLAPRAAPDVLVVGTSNRFAVRVAAMAAYTQPRSTTAMLSWMDSSTLETHCLQVSGTLSSSFNTDNANGSIYFHSDPVLLTSPGTYTVHLAREDSTEEPWWLGAAGLAVVCPHGAEPVVSYDQKIPANEQNTTKCQCRTGLYALGDPVVGCSSCPVHGLCNGSQTISALPGYWQAPENPHRFLRCVTGSCLRGPSGASLCAEGHSGPLCGLCEENYAQYGFGGCRACPPPTTTAVGVILGVVCWIALCIAQSWFALGWSRKRCTRGCCARQNRVVSRVLYSDSHPASEHSVNSFQDSLLDSGKGKGKSGSNRRRTNSGAANSMTGAAAAATVAVAVAAVTVPRKRNNSAQILSIIVSTTQANSLLLNVDYRMGGDMTNALRSAVGSVLSVQAVAQGASASLPSFSCLLNSWMDPSWVHYTKVALLIALPLVVCIVLLLARFIYNSCCRGDGSAPSMAVVWVPVVAVWGTLQGILATTLFQTASCRTVNSSGWGSRLAVDMAVPCGDSTHHMILAVLVAPAIALYFALLPALLIIAMRSRIPGTAELSFLTQGFKSRYNAWWVVILARKLVLALLATTLQTGEVQLAALSLVLTAAFALQLSVRPAAVSVVNYAETLSLASSAYIFLLALATMGSNPDDEASRHGRTMAAVSVVVVSIFTYLVLFSVLVWDRKWPGKVDDSYRDVACATAQKEPTTMERSDSISDILYNPSRRRTLN